jgi:integrase
MGVKVRQWKDDQAWWIFVNHHRRRRAVRVGVGVRAKKVADEAARQIAARLALGDTSVFDRPGPPAAAKATPTFGDVAREWLAKYPALHPIRPTTVEDYAAMLKRHLLPAFGVLPVIGVTAGVIEDFIEAKRAPGGSILRRGKPLGEASLRVCLVVARLVLQRAVRLKLLAANPMTEVEWTRAPVIENVDPFSPHELRAMLESAATIDPDIATLLRLWAQSGMREGEVLGLQHSDIDFERGTALVRRTWTRGRLGPTKTGRERETSFLHPTADDITDWRPGAGQSRSVLAALRALKVHSLDPEAPVFTRGGKRWTPSQLAGAWRRILSRAGVRYRAPENLRHSWASIELSRNAPLLFVQAQGGWRSASVLLRVYARWMPGSEGVTVSSPSTPADAVAEALDAVTAASRPQPGATKCDPGRGNR